MDAAPMNDWEYVTFVIKKHPRSAGVSPAMYYARQDAVHTEINKIQQRYIFVAGPV